MISTYRNGKTMPLIKSLAIVLSLLAILALTASKLSTSRDFTYYSNGKYVTVNVTELIAKEADSNDAYWHANPAFVAAVTAPYLRPPVVNGEAPKWSSAKSGDIERVSVVTKSWNVRYEVLSQSLSSVIVGMSIDDDLYYIFTLEKPVSNYWYITRIDDVSHNGTGPNIANAIHLVPLRPALIKNGLTMKWNAKTKVAEILGTAIRGRLQVGYDVVEINGREYTTKASPTLIKGKLYVADDVISEIIALKMSVVES